MALNVNYVKFRRGTPAMFEALTEKDADCLYFISEKNATKGLLYLGDKLIKSSITSDMTMTQLEDVLLGEDIPTNSMLIYDGAKQRWINKPFSQIFEEITNSLILITMTGATANRDGAIGTVPKPLAGQQDMYLKGDGTWSDITRLADNRERELTKMRNDLDAIIGDDVGLSMRAVATRQIRTNVIAGASGNFDNLEKAENFVANQVSIINTKISAINTDIGDLNQEIIALKNKDIDLQIQINDLDERLQWRNIANP